MNVLNWRMSSGRPSNRTFKALVKARAPILQKEKDQQESLQSVKIQNRESCVDVAAHASRTCCYWLRAGAPRTPQTCQVCPWNYPSRHGCRGARRSSTAGQAFRARGSNTTPSEYNTTIKPRITARTSIYRLFSPLLLPLASLTLLSSCSTSPFSGTLFFLRGSGTWLLFSSSFAFCSLSYKPNSN